MANTLIVLVLLFLGSLLIPLENTEETLLIVGFRLIILIVAVILSAIYLISKRKELSKVDFATVLGLLVVLYIGSLFTPLLSPYSKFPLFVVKCRGLPVVASNFAAGNDYAIPGDWNYRITPFTDYYFCTEKDAQNAWFSRNDRSSRPHSPYQY